MTAAPSSPLRAYLHDFASADAGAMQHRAPQVEAGGWDGLLLTDSQSGGRESSPEKRTRNTLQCAVE